MLSLSSIRRSLTDTAERLRAQDQYFDRCRTAGRLLDRLVDITDPGPRAAILDELANVLDAMAEAHRAGRGPGPVDLADAHVGEALLYRLVADTERAFASSGPRRRTGTVLEPCAGPVLDRMAATADPEQRGMLLDDLYEAVTGVVGGQAAEAIRCLPAPGQPRIRMLRQIAAAVWSRFGGRGPDGHG